jgi:FlaG/FlaF family flagellin (archaellin)
MWRMNNSRKGSLMKRVAVILTLFALVLAGCGGSSTPATVPTPPNASAYAKGSSTQLNTIVEQWQAQVPQTLVSQGVKQETIEAKTYQSSDTLQQVADFYAKSLAENGWTQVRGMPGVQAQNGFYTDGYDHGTTHLSIGAVDATKFGGKGVVIYTASGTK